MFISVYGQAAARFNQHPSPSFLLIIEHRRIARCFPGDYKFASHRFDLSRKGATDTISEGTNQDLFRRLFTRPERAAPLKTKRARL
jgi:hypothetical protein